MTDDSNATCAYGKDDTSRAAPNSLGVAVTGRLNLRRDFIPAGQPGHHPPECLPLELAEQLLLLFIVRMNAGIRETIAISWMILAPGRAPLADPLAIVDVGPSPVRVIRLNVSEIEQYLAVIRTYCRTRSLFRYDVPPAPVPSVGPVM